MIEAHAHAFGVTIVEQGGGLPVAYELELTMSPKVSCLIAAALVMSAEEGDGKAKAMEIMSGDDTEAAERLGRAVLEVFGGGVRRPNHVSSG